MKRPDMVVGDVLAVVMHNPNVRSAVKFISPTSVVKITRRRRMDRRDRSTDFVLTVGKPNFAERLFVKMARAAKEPFPVKRVMTKGWPRKKK